MTTVREWAWNTLVPTWMKYGLGARVLKTGLLRVSDVCADILLRAAMTGMVKTPYCGAKSLVKVGLGRGLPWYPGESLESYRERVWTAWEAYDVAGADGSLIRQLQSAGYAVTPYLLSMPPAVFKPATYKIIPWDNVYPSKPWNSAYVIVLTVDSAAHPAVNCPIVGDAAVCGETVCGTSLSQAQVEFISSLIEKWYPPDSLCRGVYFTATNDPIVNWDEVAQYLGFVPPNTPEF
jgi:hypothetical protein